jgi:hypothetical protein
VVAVHAMVGAAERRLDGGAALHLAFDGGGGPPDPAADRTRKRLG